MEKQQVSYWELEGTYQEIGKQMAKQPEKNHIYSGSGEVRRKRNGGSLPII